MGDRIIEAMDKAFWRAIPATDDLHDVDRAYPRAWQAALRAALEAAGVDGEITTERRLITAASKLQRAAYAKETGDAE